MMEMQETERENASHRMIDILNSGALNLAMAIGYRTGLFEAMDFFETPQTLSTLAGKAGLSPRYVKEWLGVMAAGGIVRISSEEDGEERFYMPKAWGDILTRRAGNSNLGVYAQEIPLLTTCAMEAVIQRFTDGEGVGYEHYPRFHAFMSELADAKHRQVLIDRFLPTVDDGRIVRQLTEGARVCDLGCGRGTAILLMAEAFPRSRFTGIDLSQDVLLEAEATARDQGLTNVEFLARDAAELKNANEFDGLFHYVTAFDSIHDQTRPLDALAGARRILTADGAFSMIDIAAKSNLTGNLTHPMGPFLYAVSLLHCLPVGLVDGGAGLGMMWGRERAEEMLARAGFQQVDTLEMPDDPFNLHFFCRKERRSAG